jgi:hypothetical protein
MEKDAGIGMVYETTGFGMSFSLYIGGGIDFGTLPTGTIDDMKNKDALKFGFAATMSPIVIGPELGGGS